MAAGAQILPFPRQSAPAADASPAKSLSALKKQFTNAVGSKTAENTEAAEAERYYHAVQWTAKDLKVLEARGQPPIVFNRIKRKIHTVCGILEKLRQDPKAYPRNPNRQAEDGAEIATKTLNYALGWNWVDLSQTVARRNAIRGIAGAEMVLTKGDNDDPEIEWDEVDQRDFFYDARSVKADFTDARYMGTSRWVDLDEAQTQWPESAEQLAAYVENGPSSDYERGDERQRLSWIVKSDRRVRIVDHWYMVGNAWHYCIYSGEEVLEYGESPFIDEKKRSVHKFEMFSCDVDQDGDRYGFFRDWKGPQDEINQRRSKALHQLNSRKVIADAGAVDDVELARREYARADGWVIKNPGKEIITEDAQANSVIEGNLNMLTEAKAEIDTYGPNPGLIGTDIPAESGRAIQLLQAAGIAELGPYVQAYKAWKLRVYRKTWNAVQRFWTSERFIRVTDDDNLAQFVQVNGWQLDETGRPMILNQLAALDVDIIIDEGADTVNTMADTLDTLVLMAKGGIQIPPEVIIELSSIPSSTKQRILAQMEKAQEPKPLDQQAISLKLQEIGSQIALLQSQASLNDAKAQEAMAKAQAALTPEGGGPQQQVDTPADLAKARLDAAKAAEIEQKVQTGVNLSPPTPAPQPGLFEVNVAKARESQARATEAEARTAKTILESRTINEAPPGMLTKPLPPKPVKPGGSNA